MIHSLDILTDEVMARLGENVRPRSSVESVGSPAIPSLRSRMEGRIASLLPEIGSALIREALPHELGGGESLAATVSMSMLPCGLYGVKISLPEDFLRVASVKMASWYKNVDMPIAADSGDRMRQWSKEAGIAGCPAGPVVYLRAGDSGPVLTAVGSETEADRLEECLIWRVPKVDSDGKFLFPAALMPVLTTRIAERLI